MAERVAEEMDVELGDEVGYLVRLESHVNEKTLLIYATAGRCLNIAISDPQLSGYGVVILDEVHERSLETDVLLGLVKKMVKQRDDLRVVIMSASLSHAGDLKQYFNITNGSAIFKINKRLHRVQIMYELTMPKNYCEMTIETILNIHRYEADGDILLFLIGQEEIETTCFLLKNQIETILREHSTYQKIKDLEILPLYGALAEEQRYDERIFKPNTSGVRRCIIATNIAENSLTIDGIVYVIDCGFAKQKLFEHGQFSIPIRKITKASAKQRAGRAGRTRPGKCYRLYTKEFYSKMLEIDPEIKHSNLCSIALSLISLGVENIVNFNFIDKPPEELLRKALLTLQHLGVIDVTDNLHKLTNLGRRIKRIPLEPQLAIMLDKSVELECTEDAIIIASMLCVPKCFDFTHSGKAAKIKFNDNEGDHFTLLRVYREFARNDHSRQWCESNKLRYFSLDYARLIKEQLTQLMIRLYKEVKTIEDRAILYKNLRRALFTGFFLQVACFKTKDIKGRLRSGFYVSAESEMIEGRPQNMRISDLSIYASQFVGYRSIDPDFILYGQCIGSCLYEVTKLKNPEILLDKDVYKTLVSASNEEFCQLLENLKLREPITEEPSTPTFADLLT